MLDVNKFPIGNSDFIDIIQKKANYIDKTLLIKDIMDNFSKIILITRPRRFGKTLGMSMMANFFSCKGKDLYQGLKIENHIEFCKKHQHQYPVIFMTFKDVKMQTLDQAMIKFLEEFSRVYCDHKYLLEGDALSLAQKKEFQGICDKDTKSNLTDALKNLIRYIELVTGKKPILFLDEYDTPIHSAYLYNFYEDIIFWMRSILGGALKDNSHLEKAVMTGITRISQESMFSGLNNLECFTILDSKYAQYFGFTQGEVELMVEDKQTLESVKSWYNGYTVGEEQIYNPWSIINYLKQGGRARPYWLNTSDNALVIDLIMNAGADFHKKIEELMEGKTQTRIIQDQLTFQDFLKNQDAIWTLLIHAGYLKVVSSHVDEDGQILATIAIPNKEVMQIYRKILEQWFKISNNSSAYDDFLASLESGDIEHFAGYIREYIRDSASYFDLDRKTPERVFHMFMLGILVGLRGRYDISSNKETGLGRADIVLIPKNPDKNAIILEFKTCPSIENLENFAKEGLDQIRQKEYAREFKGKKTHIAMAFCAKEMAYSFS